MNYFARRRTKDGNVRRKLMKKLMKYKKRSVTMAVIICLVAMIVFYSGYSIYSDVYGRFDEERDVYITIPAGSGIAAIADILHKEGIIKFTNIFRLIAKQDEDSIYQQGNHIVNTNMSYKEILERLQEPPISNDDLIKLTIPEGFELRQIADLVEEKGIASREEFLKEADKGRFDYDFLRNIKRNEYRLEGYLFPATYEIYKGESVHSVIDKMLKKFSQTVIPLYVESGTEKTLDEIVIMASIVEREAANDSERARVASVFYNRIKKDMTLSSCATVQYILKERKAILSNSDVKIESEYNTYIHKGLPKGPIASPGEKSVISALYPENTEYLFFVSDGTKNVFSVTDEEHMSNVRRIQNGG